MKNLVNFQKTIFKNSFVNGSKIRFKWALNSPYGDANYTLYCQSERQSLEIAQTLDLCFTNGENFAALMDIATKMLEGFSLIRTRKISGYHGYPDSLWFIGIENRYYCIEYSELTSYSIDEIKHLL
jgi:hypothetical protein